MRKHQTVLGSIFLAFGLVHVIGIVVLIFVFGMGSIVLFAVGSDEPGIPGPVKLIPAGLGLFISIIVALTALPNLIAAYGLLKDRDWAMTAALIVGILNLVHFPFGTAAGIYAVWVYVNHREESHRAVVL